MNQRGFSLVELMISLALGLVITAAVIQIMVSNQVTNRFNTAVAQVQESGRFIMLRLQRDLLETGRYDLVTAQIDNTVDPIVEAAFVQNNPVGIVGQYTGNGTLGSTQGATGGNDQLVVNLLGDSDCNGNRHGYTVGDQFHVVNHYYVTNDSLYCRGFDGRALRGLRVDPSPSSGQILIDNVDSFQVQYGVTAPVGGTEAQAVRYITADELDDIAAANQQVVALRIGLLLYSDDGAVNQLTAPRFAVLNETAVTKDTQHYYQVFSHTMTLRNMKNFVRSIE